MKNLWLILLLLCMFACKEEERPLPLPEEDLIPVLIDIHIAEAALQNLRGDTRDSMANIYYSQISTIHDVERSVIDTCLEIMRAQPIMLEKIYNAGMDTINRLSVEQKGDEPKKE
jgi:hypothetical protein